MAKFSIKVWLPKEKGIQPRDFVASLNAVECYTNRIRRNMPRRNTMKQWIKQSFIRLL